MTKLQLLLAAVLLIGATGLVAAETDPAVARPAARLVGLPEFGDPSREYWWTGEPKFGPKRKALARKTPTELLDLPPVPSGRIIVKFRDDLEVRAPRTPVPAPVSLGHADLSAVEAILASHGTSIRQWINRTPTQLAELTQRAFEHSGRPQPDLASILMLEPGPDRLLQVARELNDLDLTDWVEIESEYETHQCDAANPVVCNGPNPNCPAPQLGNCNPDPGNMNQAAEWGCADVACCDLVAAILPECDDVDSARGWDRYCAAIANAVCDGTIYDLANPTLTDRYDPCLRDDVNGGPDPLFAAFIPLLQGGCFEPSGGTGCNQPDCCNAICLIDPSCCNTAWDAACVNLAFQTPDLCSSPAQVAPSPDMTPVVQGLTQLDCNGNTNVLPTAVGWQAYTVSQPVLGQFSDPSAAAGFAQQFLARGFRGGGLDLEGLRSFSNQYAIDYQGGAEPIVNGRTINVGVIEFSAFVNHEDFLYATPLNDDGTGGELLDQPKVILEPGQTPILYEIQNIEPGHGTACLGQIVAADNGFGVTGIAHEAQGWFFPTVSVEEGGRTQNAIVSALETFGPGDVLNMSFGPGCPQPRCEPTTCPTLVSQPGTYTLVRLGSDLGITSCISAGNSNAQIEAEAGEIRSGALIVGASWPGALAGSCSAPPPFPGTEYCRLAFSNWSSGEEALAVVDVHAWGTLVATTGYGDFFTGATAPGTPTLEADKLRTYSISFGGTSAAAPIVAGTAAVVQGFAKQVFGVAVSPEALGEALRNNGSFQCGFTFEPVFPGNDECPGSGDNLIGDGAEIRHRIGQNTPGTGGVFPDPFLSATALLAFTEWPSIVDSYRIRTGTELSEYSRFRLSAQDGIAVEIATQRDRPGHSVAGLVYLTGGWMTDIEVIGTYDGDLDALNGLQVANRAAASASSVVRFVYILNRTTRRYEYVGVDVMPQVYPTLEEGPDVFVLNPFLDPADFVDATSGEVVVRIYTSGLGATPRHRVYHDFIQIAANPYNPIP